MSCLDLGVNPALSEILSCSVELGAGGAVMAAVLMFILMFYAMYRLKIPAIAMVPLGLFIIYVFAGSRTNLPIGGLQIFANIGIMAIMAIGAIFVFAIWRFRS